MSRLFKFRENEKGQAIVEFALVLPILMLLILGIIEFGWLFNGKLILTSAAREGARVVAVTKSEGKAEAAVRETSDLTRSGLTNLHVDISYVIEGPNDVNRSRVLVTAEMDPLIGLFVSTPVNIKAEAYMRQE